LGVLFCQARLDWHLSPPDVFLVSDIPPWYEEDFVLACRLRLPTAGCLHSTICSSLVTQPRSPNPREISILRALQQGFGCCCFRKTAQGPLFGSNRHQSASSAHTISRSRPISCPTPERRKYHGKDEHPETLRISRDRREQPATTKSTEGTGLRPMKLHQP